MSWIQRRQAARQRRQDILRDLRENGWPGLRRELRNRGERVARVVAQAPGKAMASGKATARKILSIQRAAGLDEKLVDRSARSVVYDQEPRHQSRSHQAWVAGYAAEVRQRLPGVLPEPQRSPEWYQINPHRPERDGPEPEA